MIHTALIYHHRPSASPLRIGRAEDRILRALARYRVATCQQLARACGYAHGSLTYVQTSLKRLTEAGYCRRPYYPRTRPTGSSPAIYTLSRTGYSYLRAYGLEVPGRYRPSEEQHSPFFYDHTIAVVDVLIAADLFCQRHPEVQVQTLLRERDLKRHPITVQMPDGTRQTVINDALLDLRITGLYQMCLAVEVDRGTEEQQAWRAKVQRLVAYAQGPFQEAYQTTALTILVMTTHATRRIQLVRWTEAELRRLGQETQADLFRVTSVAAATASPDTLFLLPTAQRPFDTSPLPVIDLREVGL